MSISMLAAGRTVNFQVLGQNSGATGVCSPNLDCTTDASGQVSFTYSVPRATGSAGTDTILTRWMSGVERAVALRLPIEGQVMISWLRAGE